MWGNLEHKVLLVFKAHKVHLAMLAHKVHQEHKAQLAQTLLFLVQKVIKVQ